MKMNPGDLIFMNQNPFGREYDSIENMQLPEIPTVIKMLINDSFFYQHKQNHTTYRKNEILL